MANPSAIDNALNRKGGNRCLLSEHVLVGIDGSGATIYSFRTESLVGNSTVARGDPDPKISSHHWGCVGTT